MEVEDRESTDSGSLSGNPESESPSLSGGDYVGHGGGTGGGGVAPGVLNMDISMEKSAADMFSPAVGADGGAVGGGGVVGGVGTDGGGVGILGGGAVGGRGGGGNGDLTMGKKKRGRPRKYDADGNLNPAYIKSPPVLPAGFTLSTPPSYEYSSGSKKGRGRPSGSGNWHILASLGELFANTAGGDFTPHVVTVHTGEDVAGKILTFAQKGHRGICVLSANGCVSNVTLRQPGSSGGLLTYEGRFEILTLTGSYTISDNGGIKSRTGGLSVSLASPDGRVIGGGVAGMLMAASPIQIVVGSFVPNGGLKPQKRKYQTEPRIAPTVQFAPATVTAATPISQAAPESNNIYPIPTLQLPVQSQGDADNSLSNKDLPNSASTDTADWNSSGPSSEQRPSPDINISVPVDEH
ncbi:AT-hook motif nuclear-localized protein 1 [Sesamum indicum]|uniref:AT-hook motif nuclear-localized protein n=1 Tax=Sesamum indicum TaxID=4182 RepID=A0A6I9UID4_SESIN|nr:AT-hook motif nuclear-localized protein 1 [Sesamum indicum]